MLGGRRSTAPDRTNQSTFVSMCACEPLSRQNDVVPAQKSGERIRDDHPGVAVGKLLSSNPIGLRPFLTHNFVDTGLLRKETALRKLLAFYICGALFAANALLDAGRAIVIGIEPHSRCRGHRPCQRPLIRDIGCAYLVAALALLWLACDYRPVHGRRTCTPECSYLLHAGHMSGTRIAGREPRSSLAGEIPTSSCRPCSLSGSHGRPKSFCSDGP